MAGYKKNSSTSRIFTFVLTVVFGLLAAVVAFSALRGGVFELRTKAAAEEVVLKQWTFDSNAEGWTAKQFGKSAVSGGNYSLIVGPVSESVTPEEYCTGSVKNGNYRCRTRNVRQPFNPRIENSAAQTVLRFVNHKLRVRLALTLGQPPAPGPGMEKQRAMVTKFPVSVSYRLQGKSAFETALTFAAVADGAAHEYSLDLPREASLKRIDHLRVSFAELRKEAGARIDVADISIIGLKEMSRPPQGQTFQGLLTKSASGASYALLVSSGGRTMTYRLLAAETSGGCPMGALCKTIARPVEINFDTYVGKQVIVTGNLARDNQSDIVTAPSAGKGSENPNNIPQKENEGMSQPLIYVTSIKLAGDTQTEPKPPTGCYYKQVQCVRAPCDPVLVCPNQEQPPVVTSSECMRAGCSGELCVDSGANGGPPMSVCLYREEYRCYADAQCERQPNGRCGWTPSTDLSSCLSQTQSMDR